MTMHYPFMKEMVQGRLPPVTATLESGHTCVCGVGNHSYFVLFAYLMLNTNSNVSLVEWNVVNPMYHINLCHHVHIVHGRRYS